MDKALQIADWAALCRAVNQAAEGGGPLLLAIDGPCGSGKTWLAQRLAEAFGAELLHMDDFYLPIARRPADWQAIPGGHMDFSRLRALLVPLGDGAGGSYRPFDCQSQTYLPPRTLAPRPLVIVEGSYSHHPQLAGLWGMKLFVTCPEAVRMARLRQREGGDFDWFWRTWPPLEAAYFRQCAVPGPDTLIVDPSVWDKT